MITDQFTDGRFTGQASDGASLPQGLLKSGDEVRMADQKSIAPPIAASVASPILTSDYQIANRWSFNFITSKTKAGYKCISLPANAPRDVLLACAIEEFKRWEARVG